MPTYYGYICLFFEALRCLLLLGTGKYSIKDVKMTLMKEDVEMTVEQSVMPMMADWFCSVVGTNVNRGHMKGTLPKDKAFFAVHEVRVKP